MLPPVQGSGYGAADIVLHPADQIIHHGLHQEAGGVLGFFGDFSLQGHKGPHHLDIRLDGGQKLRLEQKLLPALALHGVILDDGYGVLGKQGAHIPQPLGQHRSGTAGASPPAG
ncbi:hypothetical protein D3C75_686800 [compost metagenome]